MFRLLEKFNTICEPIIIIDVGAMDYDDGVSDYQALLRPGASKVIYFEPIEEDCKHINISTCNDRIFLPYFVGDGSKKVFHQCKHPMCSSLYPPNISLINNFQGNFASSYHVTKKSEVQTHRLDDIDEVFDADYLNVDVQGAELDVLKGGVNVISDVMVIHSEVEFVPMYINQPLFSGVDQFLRKHGFLFYNFYLMRSLTLKYENDVTWKNQSPWESQDQAVWADAIYVKDITQYDQLSPQKLLKLAIIMHDVYNAFDLAYFALQSLDQLTNSQLAIQYHYLFENEASVNNK